MSYEIVADYRNLPQFDGAEPWNPDDPVACARCEGTTGDFRRDFLSGHIHWPGGFVRYMHHPNCEDAAKPYRPVPCKGDPNQVDRAADRGFDNLMRDLEVDRLNALLAKVRRASEGWEDIRCMVQTLGSTCPGCAICTLKAIHALLTAEHQVAGQGDAMNDSAEHTTRRVAQLRTIQEEAAALFARKNADYGDAFAKHGPVGVLIRVGDKIDRLVSISKSGVALVDSEGLRDTLIDLHNYAAMAVMLMDEEAVPCLCGQDDHTDACLVASMAATKGSEAPVVGYCKDEDCDGH